jgi:hypothetical protein
MIRAGSSVAERTAHPPLGGGSIPTPSLQSLRVRICHVHDIQGVIERVHYSHSIFGVTTDFCYAVEHRSVIVGGAIFGKPAAYNVAAKYGAEGLTELRRFVLTDECPRNSESRVIGFMLRDLKREGVKRVLSYADPAHGHSGVIYKALGFKYMGKTAKRKHIMWKGKKYPDRNVHQVNFPFHLELRAALADGSATRVEVPGKHIYLRCFTPSG